ncbi:MAG TPA: trehalose-6-phosphate synthase [Ktedonobacteraceae bacterium]|nr:trehalose-6-phosphate synthase [Ktedonobacteraceae bacterium]
MSLFETFPPISMHESIADDKPDCIIVSNCGPLEYYVDDDGRYKARQGSGGLVTTLLGAIQHRRVSWIALTVSKADHPGVRTDQHLADFLLPALADVTLHLLSLPQETYDHYYHHISNNVLWPAQHFLLDPVTSIAFTQQTRNDWEQGYCVTNEAVAHAIIRELERWGTDVPVIVQDYQLYLVAAHVRAHCPSARLSHVIYIPWPDPRYLALLPGYMTQAIYQSMAVNDIISFQTWHDARNFLAGATCHLDDAQVVLSGDNKPGTLHWQGRSAQVCVLL